MIILEDTYGVPQCGLDIKYFENIDELTAYLEDNPEVHHRILTGYANFHFSSQEKEDNMTAKNLVICDWETKGNVVRLYCCDQDKYDEIWGDDWNDIPYEHNAGRVYDEYVHYIVDLYFSWNVDILEAEHDWEYQGNSPYSKEMFKNRLAPIFIAYWLDENEWSWDKCYSRFQGADNSHKVLKFYMGDELKTCIAGLNKKVLSHWDMIDVTGTSPILLA